MVKKQNFPGFSRFVALALMFTCGCYLLRYEAVMDTHLTLMEQYSTKLQYMADNRLVVAGGDWVEFEYPGERAADFSRIVGDRFRDRESFVAFQNTLAIYQALMSGPEILKRSDAVEAVAAQRAILLEAIRVNREALAAEN